MQEHSSERECGAPGALLCIQSLIPSGYEHRFAVQESAHTSYNSDSPSDTDESANGSSSEAEEEEAWTLVEHRGRGPIENQLWKAWLRGDGEAAKVLLSTADYQKRMGAGAWAWPADKRRREAKRCAQKQLAPGLRCTSCCLARRSSPSWDFTSYS